MPDIVQKAYGYHIYFWSNEGDPVEPIHFHVSQKPHANATKVWIASSGKLIVENNNDRIPASTLSKILNFMSQSFCIEKAKAKWMENFESIRYKV